MRNDQWKLITLIAASLVVSIPYVFYELNGSYDYALPRRGIKLLAMIITAVAIAYSTVIFQTITHNRILTPSIMGLDSMYVLIQTIIVFFFGSTSFMIVQHEVNFFISVVAMLGFAVFLFNGLFKNGKRPIYFLLLVGIILGTFLSSISTFLQVIIDPNEFFTVQDRMFASFQNVNDDLVWIGLVIVVVVIIYNRKMMNVLDAISLGKEISVNLGVSYNQVVRRMLISTAVLISVSTALVGPITFFGLIVANLSYQFFRTYQHKVIVTGAISISIILLVGGQFVVERIFTFSTTLSVIINFVGGVYFIYLLLRESKTT